MRFVLLLAVLLAAACAHRLPEAARRGPVILVSIDGFRADYLGRGLTPNLSKLAEEGASAPDGMRPSFPSLTYPNHYALVTGRRPDRNGIVSNTMEDPAIPGVVFGTGHRDAVRDHRWWDEAEPIWNSAERAGLKTAPDFWPGTEAEVHGLRPSRWLTFDQSKSSADRAEALLTLFDGPDRPAFATLYLDIVDTQGHRFGPDSAELNAALREADAAVGRLIEGLKARGLFDRAEIVIVSDHGMAATRPGLRIIADDWAPPEVARLVYGGATAGFVPQPGREAEARAKLLAPHKGARCWAKADLPGRFHYGRNPRVPPIVCLADLGGYIVSRKVEAGRTGAPDRGAHGYDPEAVEMRALFIAHGPAFRPGARLAPFDNVSVYPLLARLLGVKAKPGDGRLSDAAAVLRP